jgi:hypothetical protein
MKQTAVEWLEEYIKCSIQLTESEKKWFEQAKEMEKQQREKDLENGFHTGRLYLGREGDTTLEQLKTETFKSE